MRFHGQKPYPNRHFAICFVVIAFLLFYPSNQVFGQSVVDLKQPKYKRAAEAYGLILGQEHFLTLIKSKFPHLELNTIKAQMGFNSTFGAAKERIKDYLLKKMGASKFDSTFEDAMVELKTILEKQEMTEERALNLISEIESRAKGNIASPILETLLSFQFEQQPHQEFQYGFINVFSTKSHAKSTNTDWQVKVPKSWKATEGERKNIIQTFVSDYGDGLQSIILMVSEMSLPKGYKFSRKELNEFFTEKEALDMVPDNGKFISFKQMTFDGKVGGMLEVEILQQRLDLEFKMRLIQFMFIIDNKMYTLCGSVSKGDPHSDLDSEVKKYLTLFKLVANSIVVNNDSK